MIEVQIMRIIRKGVANYHSDEKNETASDWNAWEWAEKRNYDRIFILSWLLTHELSKFAKENSVCPRKKIEIIN